MSVLRSPVVAVTMLAACTTQPFVDTDIDPRPDFSRYHTYGWVDQQTPPGANPVQYKRARDSIARHLEARGLSEGRPADFAVAVALHRRDFYEVTDLGLPEPGGDPFGRDGYDILDGRNVAESWVVIDVYDVVTDHHVWRGVARQTISTAGAAPEDIDRQVSRFSRSSRRPDRLDRARQTAHRGAARAAARRSRREDPARVEAIDREREHEAHKQRPGPSGAERRSSAPRSPHPAAAAPRPPARALAKPSWRRPAHSLNSRRASARFRTWLFSCHMEVVYRPSAKRATT